VETIKHVITSPLLWMVVVGVVVGCYGWLRRREDEPYVVITMVGSGTLLIGSLIGSFVWLLVTSDLARFHIKVAILIACAAAVLVSVLLIQEGGTVALVSFLVLAVTVPLGLVIGVSLLHRSSPRRPLFEEGASRQANGRAADLQLAYAHLWRHAIGDGCRHRSRYDDGLSGRYRAPLRSLAGRQG